MNTENQSIIRGKNIATIFTESGTFTMHYSQHLARLNPNDFPSNINGVIIETGSAENYAVSPDKALGEVTQIYTHKKLLAELAERKVPIYFMDSYSPRTRLLVATDLIMDYALILGGAALVKLATEDTNQFKMAAELLAASWLLAPGVGLSLKMVGGFMRLPDSLVINFGKLAERLHPEHTVVTLKVRNNIFAEKAIWLNKQVGGNKHYVLQVGADHAQLEDDLRNSSETRLQYLQKTKWFWNKYLEPRSMYTIQGFEYKRKRWQTAQRYEVPELKQLVET